MHKILAKKQTITSSVSSTIKPKNKKKFKHGSNGKKIYERGCIRKYPAICEHHLYNKAYKLGNHLFGKYVCVYVLKDYMAKKLALSHPDRIIVNRL